MATKICLAGATGWAGSAVAAAVMASPKFELVGATSRSSRGQPLGSSEAGARVELTASVQEALRSDTDVLIDYTHPTIVKDNVEQALTRGVAVVIGTSGLTSDDFDQIDRQARELGVGVIAAGNFSITAALAKHFAGIAARYVPHWEVIDYAHGDKPDAPSGTARELAEHLGDIAENKLGLDVDETIGAKSARGASIGGAQVHSVRLPGHVLSFEALFGLPNERLSIRHDAGSGADPYVAGTLLAAERAMTTRGLVRGLDKLLFGDAT